MSTRVLVEKTNYICPNRHVTKQRKDKPAPKVCQICRHPDLRLEGDPVPQTDAIIKKVQTKAAKARIRKTV